MFFAIKFKFQVYAETLTWIKMMTLLERKKIMEIVFKQTEKTGTSAIINLYVK